MNPPPHTPIAAAESEQGAPATVGAQPMSIDTPRGPTETESAADPTKTESDNQQMQTNDNTNSNAQTSDGNVHMLSSSCVDSSSVSVPCESSSSSSSSSVATVPTAAAAAVVAADSQSSGSSSNNTLTSDIPNIDTNILKDIEDLLFGPISNCSENDRNRWRHQGFVFSRAPRTLFGLSQESGGPCGVLAPVQAFVIQKLLFAGGATANINAEIPVAPTTKQQDDALVWALTHIIARTEAKAFVMIEGNSYESLHLHRLPTIDDVNSFLFSHLPLLHSPLGVLTFVYSVLLTRGLDVIRGDMDDPTSYLVGQFGHSSQELVNLMMTGRAVTNVFDGEKVLGDANDPTAFRLKGIPAQNEIGFLTLLEALRYSTVGEYYKSPKFPIWVIGSSNHYTVMFSHDRRVGQLTSSQKKAREARSAFDVLDPENNGFIPTTSLEALLSRMSASVLPPNTNLDEVRRRLDPDGLGLILYERVLTVLDQWEKLKHMTAAQAALPSTPFSCTACTFNNIASAQTCEICGTPRPPPPTPTPAKAEEVEIQNFQLYHFNGIEIPNKVKHQKRHAFARCANPFVVIV